MPDSVADVLKLAKEERIEAVDFKFVDLPGLWHHFSIPAKGLDEGIFEDGLGFDGSSIRGFQRIEESDMLLIPDPTSAKIDPIPEAKTLSLICNVADPISRESYSRDPRYVAQKAERYLGSTGVADTSYWGPEAECFIFDSVRFGSDLNFAFYEIDSDEGIWNSGQEAPNTGYRPRLKGGYFPVAPMDKQQDLRHEIMQTMLDTGIDFEVHHH